MDDRKSGGAILDYGHYRIALTLYATALRFKDLVEVLAERLRNDIEPILANMRHAYLSDNFDLALTDLRDSLKNYNLKDVEKIEVDRQLQALEHEND